MRSYHYQAYHYHARLDLENFAFVALPRAARLQKTLRSYNFHGDHYHAQLDFENLTFIPLPRVPLPRAAGLSKFCVRNPTTHTTTTRAWTLKILRSYHFNAGLNLENFSFVPLSRGAELRKFCVRTTNTRTTTTRTTTTRGWT